MRWALTILLLLSFLVIETLLGGTRPVFSLPAYALLAVAGLLTLLLPWRAAPVARAEALAVTGLFVGWILCRAAWSPVEYLARADVGLALAALGVYLLTALVLAGSRHRLTLVLGLMGIAVVQTVVGGMQQFGGGRFALFGLLEPEDYGRRASGLYICPNHLAGFLEVTMMLGLGVACWSRRGMVIRMCALVGSAASLFGLALTGSRGGYVSAACGLVVFGLGSLWVLWSAGGRRAWAGLAVGGVMGVTVLAGLTAVYSRQAGVQVRVSKFRATDDERYRLWQAAWEQAKLQPVAGTGSGSHQYYARSFLPPNVVADPVHAHNDYLQLLAEYGSVGLLAGLLFLGGHAWGGLQTLRHGRPEYAASPGLPRSDRLGLNLGALAAVTAMAVHSFVDFNLHVPANAMLMAFVFGLLVQPRPLGFLEPERGQPCPRDPRSEVADKLSVLQPLFMGRVQVRKRQDSFQEATRADHRLSMAGRVALVAAACWMAAVAVPTLPAEYDAERARLALRAERFEETVVRAQAGLAWDKRNPFLWLYLGQAHAAMGETQAGTAAARPSFEAAVGAFQSGLALYPQEQWLLVGLGEALDALGRFDEADVVFRQALRWNPASARMHFHLANHLRLAGRDEESEAAYKRSLELFYTPGAAHGLELLVKARGASPAP